MKNGKQSGTVISPVNFYRLYKWNDDFPLVVGTTPNNGDKSVASSII